MPRTRTTKVHPVVETLAAYSWRLLVIAAVAVGLLWLIGELWVVFFPLALAVMLTRILVGPTNWLRGHGWRPALAAAAVLLGFILSLMGVLGLIGLAVGQQSDRIGPAMTQSMDGIEDWLVDDAPGDLTHADIQKARKDVTHWVENWLRSSGGTLVSGVVVAFEVLIGIFLGLIITFFALKDGDRFGNWLLSFLPRRRRRDTKRLAGTAWATLGGYLRGAALLGLVEGVIIGGAVALVGAQLAVPIAVITFLMAFIPLAGAIIAGAVAVLVTLSTAGLANALIVLGVAIVVQQTDNDLLAPFIYGSQLELHPVVILLAITGGGTMFGVAGAFLAVPIVAVVLNVIAEQRRITGAAEQPAVAGASGDPPLDVDPD